MADCRCAGRLVGQRETGRCFYVNEPPPSDEVVDIEKVDDYLDGFPCPAVIGRRSAESQSGSRGSFSVWRTQNPPAAHQHTNRGIADGNQRRF